MDCIQKKIQNCSQQVETLLHNIDQLIKDKRGAKRVSDQRLYIPAVGFHDTSCVSGSGGLMYLPGHA